MKALIKTFKTLGYSNEDLTEYLSKIYLRNINDNEKDKKNLTGDEKKDKTTKEQIEERTERIRLIKEAADRLKIKLKKGAA